MWGGGAANDCNGYQTTGNNNRIIVVENGVERELGQNERIDGLNININGNYNIVKINLPIVSHNSMLQISNDNCYFEAGPSNDLKFFVCMDYSRGQKCIIGKNTTMVDVSIRLSEGSSCFIGDDCMFSAQIEIWGADGHAILDQNSKEVLNLPKHPVVIGNHCWIGAFAHFHKGAFLRDNSIVGEGSIVTRTFDRENVVIAGNPAKIVKENITWSRFSGWGLKEYPWIHDEIKNGEHL